MKFFAEPDLEFATEVTLGSCSYQAAELGEVLATIDRVTPGDPESWFRDWSATAVRVRGIAEDAEDDGHRVTAALAYLRAATYFAAAMGVLDATDDPTRLLPTWREHRACWDRFARLRGFPAVEIRYEQTTLPGYFLPATGDGPARRPLVILNNGSDGPISAMWVLGGAGALARGYHALIFDGPGQQAALYERGLHFRPDWEHVITPVVDWARSRDDVDPGRIALAGVSQGGYWVARAVAFEHRIAAAVVDPGVTDVSTLWLDSLPPPMLDLLDHEKAADFDDAMRMAAKASPRLAGTLAARMRPYGMDSPYEVFREVRRYALDGDAARIACPTLVLDPEGEQFWPGQSQALYDELRCPKTLLHTSAAEGADSHCEPKTPVLRDQYVYDWLAEVFAGEFAVRHPI